MQTPQLTQTGTVKWYNVRRGFGFIRVQDTAQDVFFHRVNLVQTSRFPQTGDAVRFRILGATPSDRALDVTLLVLPQCEKVSATKSPHCTASPTGSVSNALTVSVAEIQQKKTCHEPVNSAIGDTGKLRLANTTSSVSNKVGTTSSTTARAKVNGKRRTSQRRSRRKRKDKRHHSQPPAQEHNPNMQHVDRDDELIFDEENCGPLCSQGQVQRRMFGPSSSGSQNLLDLTSSLTDVSRPPQSEC